MRELLNGVYQDVENKKNNITTVLSGRLSDYEINIGFYNGHYHKNDVGEYKSDLYPIPVIGVAGLCDIEIDFDCITVTAKLSKSQIAEFDWVKLDGRSFNIYGVENFLKDYGDDSNIGILKDNLSVSTEKEFFISFPFSFETDIYEIVDLISFICVNNFYY